MSKKNKNKWIQINNKTIIKAAAKFLAIESNLDEIHPVYVERKGLSLRATSEEGDYLVENVPSDIMEYFKKSSWSDTEYNSINKLLSKKCASNVPDEVIDDNLKELFPDAKVEHEKHLRSIQVKIITTKQPIITHKEEIRISKGDTQHVLEQIRSYLINKNIPKQILDDQRNTLLSQCYEYADKKLKDSLAKIVDGRCENDKIIVTNDFGTYAILVNAEGLKEFHDLYRPNIIENQQPDIAFSVDSEKEKENADKYIKSQVRTFLDRDYLIELSQAAKDLQKTFPGHDVIDFVASLQNPKWFDFSIKRYSNDIKNVGSFNFAEQRCCINNPYGKIEITQDQDGKLVCTAIDNKYCKKIREYAGNIDTYQRISFFIKKLDEYNLVKVTCKSGHGVLVGETKFTFTHQNGFSQVSEYKGNGLGDSFEVWSESIISMMKCAADSCLERDEERKRKVKENFSRYIGDYLAWDIINLVKKNNKCITPTAIAEALRGRKIQLNVHVSLTEACGKYNFLEEETIKERVYDLCYAGVLYIEEAKNTYTRFDIIHVNNNADFYLSIPMMSDTPIDELKEKEYRSSAETYRLWISEKDPSSLEDNLRTIELMQDYVFVCQHIAEIANYFKLAPKETMTYIHMLENNESSKTMKRILKKIRRRVSDCGNSEGSDSDTGEKEEGE